MSGGQQSIYMTAIKLSCVIIFTCFGGSRSPADYTDFFENLSFRDMSFQLNYIKINFN